MGCHHISDRGKYFNNLKKLNFIDNNDILYLKRILFHQYCVIHIYLKNNLREPNIHLLLFSYNLFYISHNYCYLFRGNFQLEVFIYMMYFHLIKMSNYIYYIHHHYHRAYNYQPLYFKDRNFYNSKEDFYQNTMYK